MTKQERERVVDAALKELLEKRKKEKKEKSQGAVYGDLTTATETKNGLQTSTN